MGVCSGDYADPMALTAISLAEAKVGNRISIASGAPVDAGVYLVRQITPLDAETFAVELQSVEGGADIEATVPGELTVDLVTVDE